MVPCNVFSLQWLQPCSENRLAIMHVRSTILSKITIISLNLSNLISVLHWFCLQLMLKSYKTKPAKRSVGLDPIRRESGLTKTWKQIEMHIQFRLRNHCLTMSLPCTWVYKILRKKKKRVRKQSNKKQWEVGEKRDNRLNDNINVLGLPPLQHVIPFSSSTSRVRDLRMVPLTENLRRAVGSLIDFFSPNL